MWKLSVNSLGTPETRRRGLSTRKARRALTSNPPGLPPDWLPESASLVIISKTTLNNLVTREWKTGRGGEGDRRRKKKWQRWKQKTIKVKATESKEQSHVSSLYLCMCTFVCNCVLTYMFYMCFLYVCVYLTLFFHTSSQFTFKSD